MTATSSGSSMSAASIRSTAPSTYTMTRLFMPRPSCKDILKPAEPCAARHDDHAVAGFDGVLAAGDDDLPAPADAADQQIFPQLQDPAADLHQLFPVLRGPCPHGFVPRRRIFRLALEIIAFRGLQDRQRSVHFVIPQIVHGKSNSFMIFLFLIWTKNIINFLFLQ